MATAADLMTLQQQIRQEIADSLQRVREEMHTAINGRLDAISSISSAMQRLSAGPAETAKPYRISDLIPKSWDGSHDRRVSSGTSWPCCICGCKRDQTRVSESCRELESVDKVERSTLAVDCTEADVRTLDTALCQVLHRTTTNEPLRMVQQVQGQRGFEAWHLIPRRYDQRNTSDRSAAYAALTTNISERDRAKDVE